MDNEARIIEILQDIRAAAKSSDQHTAEVAHRVERVPTEDWVSIGKFWIAFGTHFVGSIIVIAYMNFQTQQNAKDILEIRATLKTQSDLVSRSDQQGKIIDEMRVSIEEIKKLLYSHHKVR